MKYFGKPTIEKIEHRLCEYIRCDSCNKKIFNNEKYYGVTTGHHDWGNDSVDSIKHKDICKDCINKYTKNYLKEIENSNSAYIEIETNKFLTKSEYYGDYDSWEDELVENDNLESKGE